MKKNFLLFLVPLIVIGSAVFANNLEKAKEKALAKREQVLSQQKEKIKDLIKEIAEDDIATGKEMKMLLEEIRFFRKLKKKFDKELKIYGDLRTETELDSSYLIIEEKYLIDHMTWLRDSDGSVRLAFAKLTGKDVRIEGAICVPYLIFGIIILFLSLCSLVVGISSKEEERFVGIIFFMLLLIFAAVVLIG